MAKLSRARRAHLQRAARQIRRRGQRAGWPVEQIVAVILQELPEILPLEAWRLGYGWSREDALQAIGELYRSRGLHAPPITAPMLCRWEHGAHPPSAEYLDALCRLYRTRPDRLGIGADYTAPVRQIAVAPSWYAPAVALARVAKLQGARTTNGSTSGQQPTDARLAAIRESVQLTLSTEGPAGGTQTLEQLDQAVTYYALHYSAPPLHVLFGEVQQTRQIVASILQALGRAAGHPQRDQQQRHLWQLAGRLSGLLGNAAFHLSDPAAASAHLDTARQLALRSGDADLVAWARGAQSMLAHYQGRFQDAAQLAEDGAGAAATPLVRAQLLAWGQLRALAALGQQADARHVIAAAARELEADAVGSAPGRFGFGPTELELHLAEAHLTLEHPVEAQRHAQTSLDHGDYGLGGWSAAQITIALAEVGQARADQAAQRGLLVLERVPPDRLRETTRKRLAALRRALAAVDTSPARDFRERLQLVPPAHPLPAAGHPA